MSKIALEYIQNDEWSAGNGQCPQCWGVREDWVGHPQHLTSATVGHIPGCSLAAALKALGGTPLMQGESTDVRVFELALSDKGFLITQIAGSDQEARGRYTEEAKKHSAEIAETIDNIIIAILANKGMIKNAQIGKSTDGDNTDEGVRSLDDTPTHSGESIH